MARSVAGAAALAAALSESIALFANRRGYAAAAAAAARGSSAAEKKAAADSPTTASTPSSNSWVPDSVTGYYRPGNLRAQPDAAELRQALLNVSNKK